MKPNYTKFEQGRPLVALADHVQVLLVAVDRPTLESAIGACHREWRMHDGRSEREADLLQERLFIRMDDEWLAAVDTGGVHKVIMRGGWCPRGVNGSRYLPAFNASIHLFHITLFTEHRLRPIRGKRCSDRLLAFTTFSIPQPAWIALIAPCTVTAIETATRQWNTHVAVKTEFLRDDPKIPFAAGAHQNFLGDVVVDLLDRPWNSVPLHGFISDRRR